MIAWAISVAVAFLAFIAWGQGYGWQVKTSYQLFPLFGLLAFSLMWSHYIAAVLRLSTGLDKTVLKDYFELTSGMVLVFILLHPGLLAWQLWRDGAGLPPGSTLNYVMPTLKTSVIFGIISLFVFLAFELYRKFGDRPWWQYVSSASDVAMLLIFIHGLRLGGQLQTGWFKFAWYFYGVSLVGSLVYIYVQKFSPSIAK
jgi:hypothetical protein